MFTAMSSPRRVVWLHRLVVVAGVVAAVWGTAQAVGAASLPPTAPVRTPVTIEAAGYRYLDLDLPTVQPTPGGEWFALARESTFVLETTGADRVGHFLSRGDAFVYGIGALVVALALAPVLTSVARQHPFTPGNVRRLVVAALTIAAAGVVGPMLPQHQGVRALERAGLADLTEPAGRLFVLEPSVPLGPLLLAAGVLAVAAAFRTGERLRAEVDGLV